MMMVIPRNRGLGCGIISEQKPTLKILNSAEPIVDILSLAISPDSQQLAVGGPAGQLILWNLSAENDQPAGEVMPERLAAEDITELAFDPKWSFAVGGRPEPGGAVQPEREDRAITGTKRRRFAV